MATLSSRAVLDIEVPDELIADHPVEADGRAVTTCACWSPATAPAAHPRPRCRPAAVPRRRRRPRRQHLPHAPRRGAVRRRFAGRHLSTDLGAAAGWSRCASRCGSGTRPHAVDHGQVSRWPAGGAAAPAALPGAGRRGAPPVGGRRRHPRAAVRLLAGEGRPIRYGCTDTAWPIADYQTVFASRRRTTPASAPPRCRRRPAVHAGAGHRADRPPASCSLRSRCTPGCRRWRPTSRPTPSATACRHHRPPRQPGPRRRAPVIAVGTTATRALETDAVGGARARRRRLDRARDHARRGLEVVDGIISGWHEPEASHLLLMEAVAGRPLLEASYAEALAERYRWHEFGDIHLVLP